jgi:hypothetical protein
VKVVHAENPLDLSEKSSQESEVPSGHPYEARYDNAHFGAASARKQGRGAPGLTAAQARLRKMVKFALAYVAFRFLEVSPI